MTILEFRYVIDPIPLKMGDTHHVTLVISPPQQLPWSPETSREAIIWAPLKEFGPKQLGEFGRWPNPPLDGNPNGSTEQKEGPKVLRSGFNCTLSAGFFWVTTFPYGKWLDKTLFYMQL